jgi:DNA-binding MarR family transcriptional regulator
MEARQMRQLGKRLVELSEMTTGAPEDIGLTRGQAVVLEEALEHPGSSISMIQERTGFTQARVSTSVARLKECGLLTTAGDSPYPGLASAWRSGTRVQPTTEAMKTINQRHARRADETVARAVADPSRSDRAIALLEELAAILL